jgi:hypothetical protein
MRRVLSKSALQAVFLWALFGFPVVLAIFALAKGEIASAIGALLLAAFVFPGAVIEILRRRRGWSLYYARQLEIRLMTAGDVGLAATGIVLLIGPFGDSRGARGAGVLLLICAGALVYVVAGGRRRVRDLGESEHGRASG